MSAEASTGLIDALWVYPVKGAVGVPVGEVDVLAGTGALHDRSLAIARGDQPVPSRTTWRPRSAFKQVARDPDMTQVTVAMLGPGAVELRHRAHPDGPPVRSDQPPEDQEAVLRRWFGEPGLRLVHAAASGLWDCSDAELSLLNLASVRALERITGRALDTRRFRANVHLDGLAAFAELSWVGRRIRLGDCEVEVIRPIQRCRATSANPSTGERDVEVPSMLARAVGYPHLGVYARLIEPARLRVGATAVVGGRPEPARLIDGLRKRREVTRTWPREAEVVEMAREDSRTVSLWLRDPYRQPLMAGQHVRVHLPTANGGLTWRAYSVSGRRDDRFRITVRLRGEVSKRLASLLSGDRLLVSGPFGAPLLSREQRPLYLISAGVGITPVAAVLQQLAAAADRRPVSVLHVDAAKKSAVLWPEVVEHVRRSGGTATLFETRPASAPARRPTPRDVIDVLPGDRHADAQALVCGSADFVDTVTRALRAAGVDANRIHADPFHSPTTDPPTRRPAPSPGPHPVTYLPEGTTATWTDADGTLLELAEQHGVPVPFSCRSGACGTCALDLVQGEVSYLVDPALPPGSRAVLACSAVPTGPIALRRRSGPEEAPT
ncbi:MOSC domain-containing protein [Actinomadura rubrisoli]|uniref:MOSC domain-containing protein n=1 Tax=Actinomadura rubrisoli TaxID=2530368 RepID=A0A4V2YXX8_9ACTN|nr:2Fe-2S iron-sulfur cluster-binding protein [Actinomadura rubrisoli]TDD91137.1 MOSC domain-containing protein [Actinomadura rubrisoli]